MTSGDRILIDVRSCGLTLSQIAAEIARYQSETPDAEIFLDGDAHAIVTRRGLDETIPGMGAGA